MSDTEADIEKITEQMKELPDMEFAADSVTGLSPSEKTALLNSFYKLIPQGEKNIESVLTSFYTKYPQHMQYFKYFKGKNPGELRGNPHFTLLATAIMGALAAMMMSLDRPSRMVDLGKNVGRFHGHRGIPASAFDDMKVAFKEVLGQVLASEWSSVSGTWSKALDCILGAIVKGMK